MKEKEKKGEDTEGRTTGHSHLFKPPPANGVWNSAISSPKTERPVQEERRPRSCLCLDLIPLSISLKVRATFSTQKPVFKACLSHHCCLWRRERGSVPTICLLFSIEPTLPLLLRFLVRDLRGNIGW